MKLNLKQQVLIGHSAYLVLQCWQGARSPCRPLQRLPDVTELLVVPGWYLAEQRALPEGMQAHTKNHEVLIVITRQKRGDLTFII